MNRRGVNVRREDIKVTFMSFGLHVGRIKVECTNMETRYFYIFTFTYTFPQVWIWIQELQSICSVT